MEQTKIPEEQTNNKPVWQTQEGACMASIWDNERTVNGNTVVFREVSFSKRYRTPDGQFKSTSKYRKEDIVDAIIALARALKSFDNGGDE